MNSKSQFFVNIFLCSCSLFLTVYKISAASVKPRNRAEVSKIENKLPNSSPTNIMASWNKTHVSLEIKSSKIAGSISVLLNIEKDEPGELHCSNGYCSPLPDLVEIPDDASVKTLGVGSSVVPPILIDNDSEEEMEDSLFEYLIYNETRRLYPSHKYEPKKNIQGPCGNLMRIERDLKNPKYLACKCIEPLNINCRSRPVIYWEQAKRCYYAYDQGPCAEMEWVVYSETRNPTCQKNPCSSVDHFKNDEDKKFPLFNFLFLLNGTCYRTDTKAFCSIEDDTAYFPVGKNTPLCNFRKLCNTPTSVEQIGICPKGTSLQDDGGCARVPILTHSV